MTTNTTFLGMKTYDVTIDASALFQEFRTDIAGTATSSNMNLLDTFAQNISASVVDLQSRKFTVVVPALYSSANYYVANGISQITSYSTNQIICLSLDTTNSGTVTLNINSLGTKSLLKLDTSGNLINFEANELKKNHLYLFKYNGGGWVWVDGTSIDQIGTIGTTNDLLMISPCGVIIDSTITTTGSRISGSYVVLTNTGVSSGSYNAVQVNTEGRVISGSNLDIYANKSISNLTSASPNVDINPSSNGVLNLGNSLKTWLSGWFKNIGFTSGSVSTPSASQIMLYANNKGLFAKNEDGEELFVSQKKNGSFFIVYPNPTITNAATSASQVELSSANYADFTNVGFSDSGSPTATIDFALPWDYDGGSFTSNVYFSSSGSVSGSSVDVRFGISGIAYGNNELLNQPPSSFIYTTTTADTEGNRLFISSTSGSFAVSGSPAPLNLVHYIIQRDNTVANNLASSVRLHGVRINYTRSQN